MAWLRPPPRMAPLASRCGSTRARWRRPEAEDGRSNANRKRLSSEALELLRGTGLRDSSKAYRAPRELKSLESLRATGSLHHVDAEESQVQKATARPPSRTRHTRSESLVWRLRPAGSRSRLGDCAPDRGCSYRHDPARQAWRKDMDSRFPRQASHQEAARDPHG